MVGYKFSKNDWVTPFLVIFRSVREILLVTVFLEHPVMLLHGNGEKLILVAFLFLQIIFTIFGSYFICSVIWVASDVDNCFQWKSMLCSLFDPLLLFNDFNFISNFALFGLRICVGLISTYMRKTGNYLRIESRYKCKKEWKIVRRRGCYLYVALERG